ncbi:uncharacterized protein LOC108252184 [Diaphorina citri]|uniref:Uncharacterized protein LOC108252184 n=1 Tax=Diaphorina citri TaxID=121845 RepID=A0A1S4E9P4_DIACI|nr:uncharacterized protein LOC108252184 [Diaphorina citri]
MFCTKWIFVIIFTVITITSACSEHRLGSKQNNVLKRHLTNKNQMLQKSLEKFEKKFESIKNMPWDYKYRRHGNKINWDVSSNMVARRNVQRNEAQLKQEIK